MPSSSPHQAAGQSYSGRLLDHPIIKSSVSGHTNSGKWRWWLVLKLCTPTHTVSPSSSYHYSVFLLWGRTLKWLLHWSYKQSTVLPQLNKVPVSRWGGTPKPSPMKNRNNLGYSAMRNQFYWFIDEKRIKGVQDLQKSEGSSCPSGCCRLNRISPNRFDGKCLW